MSPGSVRYKLFGLLGVAALATSVFVVVAAYTQLFVPVVHATVVADRSGLLLERKADVTLRGITIGEARSVDAVDGKAVIDIAIDRDRADAVPAGVTARIIAPTVFGAKFIDLVPPSSPGAGAIADGTVIPAVGVPTETNSVFDSVMALLTTVKPAKLNATLGAVATALRGHGTELGQFVTDLSTYLARFNPTLPAASEDLAKLPDVAATYADVAPDVLRIAGNVSTTAGTVREKEAGLNAMLLSVTRTADNGRSLLNDHGGQLVAMLDTLRPTTELLAYYAPAFPCMFSVVNALRLAGAQAVGGQYNGIHGIVTFLPGQPGYQAGVDLPKVAEKAPPKCYPALQAYGPHYEFDDGTITPDFDRKTTQVITDPLELARQLLGPSIVPYVDGGRR
jgi:phospholipid/cholesterol/gamma-HCH transport system substrate-binding protein